MGSASPAPLGPYHARHARPWRRLRRHADFERVVSSTLSPREWTIVQGVLSRRRTHTLARLWGVDQASIKRTVARAYDRVQAALDAGRVQMLLPGSRPRILPVPVARPRRVHSLRTLPDALPPCDRCPARPRCVELCGPMEVLLEELDPVLPGFSVGQQVRVHS